MNILSQTDVSLRAINTWFEVFEISGIKNVKPCAIRYTVCKQPFSNLLGRLSCGYLMGVLVFMSHIYWPSRIRKLNSQFAQINQAFLKYIYT